MALCFFSCAICKFDFPPTLLFVAHSLEFHVEFYPGNFLQAKIHVVSILKSNYLNLVNNFPTMELAIAK